MSTRVGETTTRAKTAKEHGTMSTEGGEFRLPDLGEGLTEAEIVAWLVRPGDAGRW